MTALRVVVAALAAPVLGALVFTAVVLRVLAGLPDLDDEDVTE